MFSPTREYTTKFTDAWNESQCDPSNLTPGGNDINYATQNLFVSHNRMHDFSYFLGFTEKNYNLQVNNFGSAGLSRDPEVGNVQAGALSGGSTGQYLGRDNANQIALQDGVPGITNQYLFQPIAGAFYSPCTDGGLDFGIVGHEYTHAISNRMIGGPDDGITSEQGGSMGESWGDLVAGEFQFEHGYDNGGNTWAVGLYATGNKKTAIRDYAINHNPLNYARVRLRHPRPRGARRRRDLERHDVAGPPGAGQEVQQEGLPLPGQDPAVALRGRACPTSARSSPTTARGTGAGSS